MNTYFNKYSRQSKYRNVKHCLTPRTVLLILLLLRDEEWAQNVQYRVMPKLTIGILGLGDIGQNLAKACKALSMTVWGVGRRDKSDRQEFVDHYTTLSRLPEVLQSCDYVCNILPSTPATKHLLSGNVLESGKDKHPVFINIGRGNVIDEQSLIHALNEGWISGAILDVFEVEPLPKTSALWKMPQVVITPHVATGSFPEEASPHFRHNMLNLCYIQSNPAILISEEESMREWGLEIVNDSEKYIQGKRFDLEMVGDSR